MVRSPLRPRFRWPKTRRPKVVLACLAASLAVAAPGSGEAQRRAYWLTKPGTTNVAPCPGNSAGEPLKVGRDFVQEKEDASDDDRWLFVDGLVTCRDEGAHYAYSVEFLHVGVNPAEREALQREALAFDWIGLAAYRGATQDRAIEWLADEALPVAGSLRRDATRPITFGDLTFRVPKRAVEQATHLTFYITAEGLLWHLPVL